VSTLYDYCSIAIFRSLTRSQLRHTSSGERYSLLLTITKSTHHCKDESLLVCCPVMPLCAVVRFIWNDLIQNSVHDTRETENAVVLTLISKDVHLCLSRTCLYSGVVVVIVY